MPRSARKKSQSCIYHIMLRGVNKTDIFSCEYDYEKFLKILIDCKKVDKFELYAYCFMSNHVHLLLKEGDAPLEIIMKRLGVKYVQWFNLKYDRVGHLFQDRFKSEPVDDDRYFMTVLRYIHQNPVKAGLCRDVSEYPFSSFSRYYDDSDIIDKSFVYELISPKDFLNYNREVESTECMDMPKYETAKRMTPEDADLLFKEVAGCTTEEFIDKPKTKQTKDIITMNNRGLSLRQISTCTGLGVNYIRYMLHNAGDNTGDGSLCSRSQPLCRTSPVLK